MAAKDRTPTSGSSSGKRQYSPGKSSPLTDRPRRRSEREHDVEVGEEDYEKVE